MKKFPPQLHLLFCLNNFKQDSSVSEKIFSSFHRFLYVKKTFLKFNKKISGDIVPEEKTSGGTVTLLNPRTNYSIIKIAGIDKIPDLPKTILQFYNNRISTYNIAARQENNSDLVIQNHRITLCK